VSLPVYWLESPAPDAPGASVVLGGPEGRHAVTVRRTRVGEQLDLVDGTGLRLRCEVTSLTRDSLVARVDAVTNDPESSPRLVVVQALAEVGADVVVPWAASRCVVQWRGERGERSLARWRSTALAAAKQARRSRVPEVAPLASTADVAGLIAAAALPVVLHESATAVLSSLDVPAIGDIVVVVGPEGGIAPEELDALGVEPVRLGPTVLRTSTAGVAACAALLTRTPRWQ
jgi:16S rRNA (uracil1498-N3)-methyltransferase